MAKKKNKKLTLKSLAKRVKELERKVKIDRHNRKILLENNNIVLEGIQEMLALMESHKK